MPLAHSAPKRQVAPKSPAVGSQYESPPRLLTQLEPLAQPPSQGQRQKPSGHEAVTHAASNSQGSAGSAQAYVHKPRRHRAPAVQSASPTQVPSPGSVVHTLPLHCIPAGQGHEASQLRASYPHVAGSAEQSLKVQPLVAQYWPTPQTTPT